MVDETKLATGRRHLLVVEDDPTIAAAVTSWLRAEGFAVTQVADGPAAVRAAHTEQPDLVVLDVMLPGLDGLEVRRRIQAERPVPVIMLTVRGDETDVLVGLGVGADDYRTKPFSQRELVARIRVLLRRVERAAELGRRADRPEVLEIGGLSIMLDQRRVGMFGGAAYRQSIGLSYAEWVHRGFGQLVVATVVVLAVVGVAARRASRRTAADRRWRQGALGGLCLLALVVAGSALHRLHLYDQAYGATRLRLLVGAFEIWVALVLLLAATVCVRLRGTWVPRTAVLLGAVILAGLTLAGPDRLVAERNVARFEATGQVDWVYLGSLSAEAVPVLDRLPEPYRSCALAELAAHDEADPRRPLDANAAHAQAWKLLAGHPVLVTTCALVASR